MSRTNARSQKLRHRSSRTVASALVAVVLLALGTLTALVAIARLVNGTWPTQVSDTARSVAALTWGSAATIAAGAVIVLLGLALLIAGLKRGAFKTARLQIPAGGPVGERDYVISTRAMARLAAAQADTVDGVDKVAASASGRRVRVAVTTSSEQADEIRERVRARVSDTLASAGVLPAPRVVATVRTKGI